MVKATAFKFKASTQWAICWWPIRFHHASHQYIRHIISHVTWANVSSPYWPFLLLFFRPLKRYQNINCWSCSDIIPGQCGLVSGFPQFHVACHGVTVMEPIHPNCPSVHWLLRVGEGLLNQHAFWWLAFNFWFKALSHYKLFMVSSEWLVNLF